MVPVLAVDNEYLFGLIGKFLARDDAGPRHDYGHLGADPRAAILEAWRFPWVDAVFDADDATQPDNAATFVHAAADRQPGHVVHLVGSFADLHTPIPLLPLADSHYATVTLRIRKGEVHHYRLRIDGNWQYRCSRLARIALKSRKGWLLQVSCRSRRARMPCIFRSPQFISWTIC